MESLKNFIVDVLSGSGFQLSGFLPLCGGGLRRRSCLATAWLFISPHPDLPPQGGKEIKPAGRKAGKYFSALVLMAFLSLAGSQFADAQSIPLNFVYTGSGSQSDVLKFSYEAGFFKKRGLDLTMLYVTSGVITSQTIVSGSALAATTTATDGLRAMAAGAPMKIVMVNIDQFQHLFVARPGINGPKDMKGKKIAVSRYGAFSDIQTRFVARQWGLDPDKDAQILQIGNSAARAAALASGGVDGAIVTPAFVPFAKKAGLQVIFDLATIKTKFASQILVAHDQLVKDRPEVARAIAVGFLDGIKAWKARPELAKPYIRKYYKVSEADVENIYVETNRFLRSEPTPDLEGIQNAWESIPELKARSVDLNRFIDPRFIEEQGGACGA
jgi:ABC-type nitrate/sulfonate/bicarbonate transport system substrate-binding protein